GRGRRGAATTNCNSELHLSVPMVSDITSGGHGPGAPPRAIAWVRSSARLPGAPLNHPSSRPLPTGGTVLPITRWGTPVMHREVADVTEFNEDLATLVRDMAATMAAAPGVGLAANQVGVDLKVFVFDCPDDDDQRVTG